MQDSKDRPEEESLGKRKKVKLHIDTSTLDGSKQQDVEQASLIFPNDVHPVHLGGKRYVVVKRFNKSVFVNLREYYTTPYAKSPAMAGRKGINLRVENWENLYKQAKEIDLAVCNYQISIRPLDRLLSRHPASNMVSVLFQSIIR